MIHHGNEAFLLGSGQFGASAVIADGSEFSEQGAVTAGNTYV